MVPFIEFGKAGDLSASSRSGQQREGRSCSRESSERAETERKADSMRSGNEPDRRKCGGKGKEQSELVGWASLCGGTQTVFNLF